MVKAANEYSQHTKQSQAVLFPQIAFGKSLDSVL